MTSTDAVITALWLLLLMRNNAAVLPLFCHFVFHLCFYLFDTNFPIFCMTALALLHCAQVNIRISSSLRYAFIALASIYWCGAADELLYNQLDSYSGVYYDFMPYLVIALNAYIASLLFRDGGRNYVGLVDGLRRLVNTRSARL